MKEIDFNNTQKKIFFCGIGGISMSGLAEILHQRGFKVCGSDMKSTEITEHLKSLGIEVFIGQSSENITDDIDLFVYTAAIKNDNHEMLEAISKNISYMERSKFLGLMMKNYKFVTAISGTHGKTTTTSMISHILLEAKKDPTICVGGILDAINGNVRIGKSQYFVVEACEYCDSFLKFFPYIGVILNIEADHLDYFKDIDQIRNSFSKFAKLIPKEGSLVINSDIDNFENIISNIRCNVITFGINSKAMWTAKNISFNNKSIAAFDIYYKNSYINKIRLSVPGIHNVYNALAACAAAYAQDIEIKDIINGLHAFCGTHRRFEYKGEVNGITIIDDYAHHPTEIKATLKVAKDYEHKKLWCVFQPHTYSRTKALLEDFASSFDFVDKLIVTDIFAAREKNTVGISSLDLVDKIKEKGKDVTYIQSFDDIQNYIINNAQEGDLLITMGAGNVDIIGNNLISKKLSTVSTGLSTNIQHICCE